MSGRLSVGLNKWRIIMMGEGSWKRRKEKGKESKQKKREKGDPK